MKKRCRQFAAYGKFDKYGVVIVFFVFQASTSRNLARRYPDQVVVRNLRGIKERSRERVLL